MIAVLGATGLLGGYILREGQRMGIPMVGTSYSSPPGQLIPLDLRDSNQMRSFLDSYRPSAVIVAAATTHVDSIEANPETGKQVNVGATISWLRELCRQGIPSVVYSSDYVFDGIYGPYREDAIPNPLNHYGRQKEELERIVVDFPGVVVIRVTHLFGWELARKNFGIRCWDTWKRGEAITANPYEFSTPTHAGVVAKSTFDLLKSGASGIFHLAGATRCSRAEWASCLYRTFGVVGSNLILPPAENRQNRTLRPVNGGLLCAKAEKRIGFVPPFLETQATLFWEEMKYDRPL
jgi:dTDP-4-dehydrorhamnose reductase